MKILILGGTRFMGKRAVQLLLDRGDAVTVVSRGNSRPGWWSRVDSRIADRHEPKSLAEALADDTWDAVLDTQAYCSDDVESIAKLLRGRVGHYLFVSTGSVYHDGKFDFLRNCPFREDSVDWSTLDYSYEGDSPEYGLGKRHAEKYLTEDSQLPYTILRIPAIQGEDDPTARIWWWIQRALDGQPFLMPQELSCPFRLLYSGDAAQTFVRVIDHPKTTIGQTYNIASREIVVPRRWTEALAAAAGTRHETIAVPLAAIRHTSSLKHYAPPFLRDTPYVHDISRAIDDFGFETTPLDDWLKATTDWYRANKPEKDAAGYASRSAEVDLARQWQIHVAKWIESSDGQPA